MSFEPNWTPLLEMRGIEKSFPGVRAITRGELILRAGEVHALLGENGAGKSTFIKILGGAYRADAGSILMDGRNLPLATPHDAAAAGIAVIYQEFNLVPALSARENIFLGHELARGGFIGVRAENRATRELLSRLDCDIDPETPCRNLTVAQQQLVEIAKALSRNARILVMDEPTAALSNREVTKLLGIVRDLRAQGLGIIYVTHRLDEVFAVCDRATVMRDGAHIATEEVSGLTRERLIEMMVGRRLETEFPSRPRNIGGSRLEVRGLRRGKSVRNVSFTLHRGEVLGITGLVGAGRTEVARLLFGADRAEGGEVTLDGRTLHTRTPREAIRAGICLLTEDRKHQGLILGLPVCENFALPNLRRFSRTGVVRKNKVRRAFNGFVENMHIRISHPDQLARNLSGGNQQKVVLAKWLQTNSEIVLIDEPTRGIDVGAKFEIYQLINDLVASGKAVLLISSELPEVLGMCDRILVMREGRIAGEITDVPHATQPQILELATQ